MSMKQESVNNSASHLSSSSTSMFIPKHQLLMTVKKSTSLLNTFKDKSEEKVKNEKENVMKETLKIDLSELTSRCLKRI